MKNQKTTISKLDLIIAKIFVIALITIACVVLTYISNL